jgi:hypothetical protein
MSASRNNVHFDNFFILIKDYCPRIRGLMVFDNELDFVWQDDSAQLAAKRVQPLLQVLKDGDTDDEIIDVDGAGFAELVKLKNEHGEMGLALCLSLEARQDAVPESVVQQRAFGLLGELLLADYQQSRALASKEDELNYMTDELTRRYEELNLIYKAEDQAMNIHHGRELLRQLVMNTSRFLNVDIIYLFIGGKNIAMHKFRGDNPVFQSDALFTTLRDSVQPMLEADKTALVINHIEDAIKLGRHAVQGHCQPGGQYRKRSDRAARHRQPEFRGRFLQQRPQPARRDVEKGVQDCAIAFRSIDRAGKQQQFRTDSERPDEAVVGP